MASSYEIKPDIVLDFMYRRIQYIEMEQNNYRRLQATCAIIISHILGGPTKPIGVSFLGVLVIIKFSIIQFCLQIQREEMKQQFFSCIN